MLLARRLIEAGTRVACISWAPDANATWDTHGDNFTKLKNELLPQLDAALSSLLADLDERGHARADAGGGHGRVRPHARRSTPQAGRDHWNFCYSLMLAGGGIKARPRPRRQRRASAATPAATRSPRPTIVATIYHCLGIPADLELRDRLQRPFALVPWGRPIADVLA